VFRLICYSFGSDLGGCLVISLIGGITGLVLV
jgi:hypothetical protein